MNKKFCVFLVLVSGLCACASDLIVTSGDNKPLDGIPVHAPMLVEVVTETTFKPLPNLPPECPAEFYCAPEINSVAKFMPLGRVYYVNFESAAFAKSEFNLTFAESGVLTGVTLNSTPSIESVTGLLEAVLPFISAPKVAANAAVASSSSGATVTPSGGATQCPLKPAEVKEKYCAKIGSTVKQVVPIEVQ